MNVPDPRPRFATAPCPEPQAFRFRDGSSARSLAELVSRLRASGSTDLASFHREHFAPWIRDILGDLPLARRVEDLAHSGAVPDVLQDAVRGLCQERIRQLVHEKTLSSPTATGS